MQLSVKDDIRKAFPDLRIGIVYAKSVDNTKYAKGLESYITERFTAFKRKYDDVRDFLDEPHILAWSEVYRSFGSNPKKKKPTAEALLSRTIKSGFIPHISPVVDIYLAAETLHYLPVGGYDLAKIQGDIVLRYTSRKEGFVGIGSEVEEFTDEKEIVYSDNKRVLTRRWNYKDCEVCKITEKTKEFVLFVEAALDVISDNAVLETTRDIADHLNKFGHADANTLFLDKSLNSITLRD